MCIVKKRMLGFEFLTTKEENPYVCKCRNHYRKRFFLGCGSRSYPKIKAHVLLLHTSVVSLT